MVKRRTMLSSSFSLDRIEQLVANGDRKTLSAFLRQRFQERYFSPLETSQAKNGFTTMAVACLVIETVEAFHQGRTNTRGKSREIFSDFFARDTALKQFGDSNDWFYEHLRCGILHQGETTGGWKIRRSGPLLNNQSKVINASRFLAELKKIVNSYSLQLVNDDLLFSNFVCKMNAICKNCN